MNKFLIIGSSGLVGSQFAKSLETERKRTPNEIDVDITNEDLVKTFFDLENDNFDTVVNFAAFTNVDAAEKQRNDEEGFCYKLNVEGAANLAKACKEYNKHLIHLSTDFVFPGTSENPGPYLEDSILFDTLVPEISWYGWTKLLAEKKTQEYNSDTAIVRIAYPFSAEKYELKLDFAQNILSLYDTGKLYPMFADQQISVLFINELIPVLFKIAEAKMTGVFHCVSRDTTTPFEFARYLLEKARLVKNAVEKSSMEDFLTDNTKTRRPIKSGLRTENSEEKLGLVFKRWKEMVDQFVLSSKT